MKTFPFEFRRIMMVTVVLGMLSFARQNEPDINVRTNEVDKVVISEWFPHEFNLNPNNATSFKISDWNVESFDDLKVLIFGRNLLGTYNIPHTTEAQKYSYGLSWHHIEFKAESLIGDNQIPFDFFKEFRYIIVPKNELTTATRTIDLTDYKQVVEHFGLKD